MSRNALDASESGAQSADAKQRTVARFAWATLAYNVVVILWGAFVRASGSGAGCGRHWPICNGEVIPRPQSMATIVEASHRLTSGLALVSVVALLVLAFKRFPRGHRVRKGAAFATGFIFGEALLGAGLVLFELVAHDTSMKRGFSMVLHLGNTFFLLAALVLTAWWATAHREETTVPPHARAPLSVRVVVALSLASVLVLASSGAIAALGDTLFPAASLREGFAQDLSPVAHVFLRLRLLHPILALGSGVLVLGGAGLVRSVSSMRARSLARVVTTLYVVQFGVGVLNLGLLAPVPMQIVHLLFADLTWSALVLMAWEAWRVRGEAAAPIASEAAVA